MSDGTIGHNQHELQEFASCRVCKLFKPIHDFYKNQLRNCNSVGECKECTKARVKARARTNPSVQEYDRARAKTPERKAKAAEITRKWRKNNPTGYAAHSAVSNAIRDGKLSKLPCEFCGSGYVHAHHKDYSKPLDVIWLCPKCHHRLHAMFPEIEGANKS
jgi:ribosomal protein S27AE